MCVGMWRSLVAHLTGGQGVAGSNPVIPTNTYRAQSTLSVGPFPFGEHMGSTATGPRIGQTAHGGPAPAPFAPVWTVRTTARRRRRCISTPASSTIRRSRPRHGFWATTKASSIPAMAIPRFPCSRNDWPSLTARRPVSPPPQACRRCSRRCCVNCRVATTWSRPALCSDRATTF